MVAPVGGGDEGEREVGGVGGGARRHEDDEPRQRPGAAQRDGELDAVLGGERADVAVDEAARRPGAGTAADGAEDGEPRRRLELAERLEAARERVGGEDRGGEAGQAEDAGEPGEEPAPRPGRGLGRDGGVEDAGVGADRLLLRGDLVQAGEQDDVELAVRRRLALDVGDGGVGGGEPEGVALELARFAAERRDAPGLDAEVEVEPLGLPGDEAGGAGAERRRLGLELGDERAAAAAGGALGGEALLDVGEGAARGGDLGGVDEGAGGVRAEAVGGGAELDRARLGIGALGARRGEGGGDGAELALGRRRVGGVAAEERAALVLGAAVQGVDAAAEVADLAVHPRQRLVGGGALPAALAGQVLVGDGVGERRGGDRVAGARRHVDDEGVEAAADGERAAEVVGHPRRPLPARRLLAEGRRRPARREADGFERAAHEAGARGGGGGGCGAALGIEHPEAVGGAFEDRRREQDGDLVRHRRRIGQARRLEHVGDLAELDLVLLEQDLRRGAVARRQPAGAEPDDGGGQQRRGEERPAAAEEGPDEAAEADRAEVAAEIAAEIAVRVVPGVGGVAVRTGVDHAAPPPSAHAARASA